MLAVVNSYIDLSANAYLNYLLLCHFALNNTKVIMHGSTKICLINIACSRELSCFLLGS